MQHTSNMNSQVQIRIKPSANEDDDMETLSLIEDVRQGFLDEISHFEEFTVEISGTQTRDAGFIVLIPNI